VTAVDVRPEPFDGETARTLLAALDAELDERYAGEGIPPPVHRPADYAPPRGAFLVARRNGEPVGCGAVRPGPEPGTGEVKRMYVVPQARGQRIAERVLAELESAARRLGYSRLVLETGTEQPEALRLYERLGWVPVPAFGHYAASPLSRCFGRDLAPPEEAVG
jgi:GNAT superfamily N-acetyltransferase